jgi:hypothetical protein
MSRKRGRGAGGFSGTSLSAHSGHALDGRFMHLRGPNCGWGHDHPAAPIERDGKLVSRSAHKQGKRLNVFTG